MKVGFKICAISDRKVLPPGRFWSALNKALRAGVPALQLREKDLSDRQLYRMAVKARTLTRRYGAKLLINGRWDIAKAVGADGVHLPEDSLPIAVVRKALGRHALIGKSTHSLAAARKAQRDGADFITFGPVFAMPSKKKYGPPLGLDRLEEVCRKVKIPVFGLGGIKTKNAQLVLARGAYGVAMISGIWNYFAGIARGLRGSPHMAQLPPLAWVIPQVGQS